MTGENSNFVIWEGKSSFLGQLNLKSIITSISQIDIQIQLLVSLLSCEQLDQASDPAVPREDVPGIVEYFLHICSGNLNRDVLRLII